MDQTDKHLLLWDGECDFCRRGVRWLQRHDKKKRFEPVPYQDAPSPLMTPELRRACERAFHVITIGGQTLRAGRAMLFVLENMGWKRLGHLLTLPPFVWIVELAYRLIASNRDFFARFLFRGE